MATISCHHARAALAGLQRKGMDCDAVLMRAGIHPDSLQAAFGRISDHQMTRLVQEIWQALDDEFMGFSNQPCPAGALGFCVRAMGRCQTLREALETGIEFYNLVQDGVHTSFEEGPEQTTIRVEFAYPELDPQGFYLEFWMIRWHRLASWLCDLRIPLLQVHFRKHPVWDELHAHRAELAIMFPSDIDPNADSNCLIIPSASLNEPVRRTAQEIEEFIRTAPAPLLTIPGGDKSLRQTIMLRLSEQIPLRFPSQAQLAEQLGLSSQAFHRRLRREGTSYQRIKDDIRRELALNKLTRERLPVHEVAEIVGFSEPRSFTRAFKSWTGLSPREYCKFV
ncbi:AraC family transcriptional regulator [Pseudomaricurvus sp. HS19]|uniref:AraC family transcriptional regulator n=1 Tax=Pseudomaricurvus sp. HS19 TaxID=2692626 RepID=UPI00136D0180|nr:AraC family transcriptional regulator [Pseudomaricurvus sp. HS19]MYM61942.1 helix-turn-helix domain-containing protein [Pseudomaricurvus sp. HS19]